MTPEEFIIETISELVDASIPITTETKLLDDLGLDSLDKVELIMKVEKAYNFAITDDEHDNICTVGELVKLIEEKQLKV